MKFCLFLARGKSYLNMLENAYIEIKRFEITLHVQRGQPLKNMKCPLTHRQFSVTILPFFVPATHPPMNLWTLPNDDYGPKKKKNISKLVGYNIDMFFFRGMPYSHE